MRAGEGPSAKQAQSYESACAADVDVLYHFETLAQQLLDRIMPLPVVLTGAAAALVGENPVGILVLAVASVAAHLTIDQLQFRAMARSGSRPAWIALCRSAMPAIYNPLIYLLAGPVANAWFIAIPAAIVMTLANPRAGIYFKIAMHLIMLACAFQMGVPTAAIQTMAVSLGLLTLVSTPLISALGERDRSLFEAAREAERANLAKSRFVATMSHEIRTPLNGMLGLADLLWDSELDAAQRKWLGGLRSSGDLLRSVVNDILDYSKIAAGRLELESRPYALERLMSRCVEAVAPMAEDKRFELELDLSPGLPGWVLGDSRRVEQILLNLLSNAIKFTLEGRVVLRVRHDDAILYAEVEDSGIGIAPSDLERLFRPFEQVDDRTNREFGGSGLGLCICARLCELMNGTIGVTSVPGVGSTFHVRLPAPRCAEPVTSGRRSRSATMLPTTEGVGRLRVLVAEDNPINQIVIERMLIVRGLDVVLVRSGAEAVAMLREREVELVLMDYHMPDMDGFAATAAIRAEELEAGRPRVPILALTADPSEEARARATAVGMDDFLTKPVDMSELDLALARWLPGERAPEA